MGPADQFKVVFVQELVCDFRPKEPAGAPGTHSPVVHLFGVRPDQVAEGALVRDLLVSINEPDVVQSANFRAESTVDTQYLLVNQSSHGQEVEYPATVPPRIHIAVLCLALIYGASININESGNGSILINYRRTRRPA